VRQVIGDEPLDVEVVKRPDRTRGDGSADKCGEPAASSIGARLYRAGARREVTDETGGGVDDNSFDKGQAEKAAHADEVAARFNPSDKAVRPVIGRTLVGGDDGSALLSHAVEEEHVCLGSTRVSGGVFGVLTAPVQRNQAATEARVNVDAALRLCVIVISSGSDSDMALRYRPN